MNRLIIYETLKLVLFQTGIGPAINYIALLIPNQDLADILVESDFVGIHLAEAADVVHRTRLLRVQHHLLQPRCDRIVS